MTTPYDALIHQVANQFGLPFDVLQSQVIQESSGDPFAFGFEHGFFTTYIKGNPHAKAAQYGPLAACSCGLLQILVETAVEHGFTGRPEDLFDPLTGLTWGATYLADCLTKASGNLHEGLRRYNGTGTAADNYANAILHRAGRL